MTVSKTKNSRSVVGESLRARRRKKARRALISYALAAAAIYAGAWHLAHHPAFAVAAVTVEGAESADESQIAEAARGALASPALSLLPMTNAYLARAGRVEAAVEEALPEVADASVARVDRTLVVTVEERARFGYWCREKSAPMPVDVDLAAEAGSAARREAGGCFALDSEGLIFASENPTPGATVFRGLVVAENPVHERYAAGEPWGNLAAVIGALRGRGFTPAEVSTPDGIDFKITLAEGPYVLVDAARSGALAIENLQVALGDDSLAALRSYGYADVRLPHKVFLGGAPEPVPAE